MSRNRGWVGHKPRLVIGATTAWVIRVTLQFVPKAAVFERFITFGGFQISGYEFISFLALEINKLPLQHTDTIWNFTKLLQTTIYGVSAKCW